MITRTQVLKRKAAKPAIQAALDRYQSKYLFKPDYMMTPQHAFCVGYRSGRRLKK